MSEIKPKTKWEKWAKRFAIGAFCFLIITVVVTIVVKETLIFGEPIYPHYTYGIELEY